MNIIIAIDGYAGCGKSTLARQLAEKLHYVFLDTGAMYRAVTLFLLQNNIDWQDAGALQKALDAIEISFLSDPTASASSPLSAKQVTVLNGKEVETEIRSLAVSNKVSEVAAVPAVRQFLVAMQREIGKKKGIVMDGRDIGTVVFPEAELKIFVTAKMEVRVERRLNELLAQGISVSAEEIRNNLIKRDIEETTRTDSPLRKAEDAILLDNSDMTVDEQLDHVLLLANNKIH